MSNTKTLKMNFVDNEKIMELSFSNLLLEQIELPDFLFDSSLCIPDQYSEVLPPIIVLKKRTGYVIIDGCKRYLLLRKKGINKFTFGIIDLPLDSFQSGMLRINFNRGRNLHLREKIKIIGWLKDNCDSDKYKCYVADLGISDRERSELERLIDSPAYVLDAIDNGYVDPGVASDLESLDSAYRQSFLQMFSIVPFSRQQQRELLEWLPEIAYAASIAIGDILGSDELISILKNDKINLPQKAQKIRDYIFKRRFPHLVEVKKRWSDIANKTNPDTSMIHFAASEAFEKKRLEVRITLTDAEKANLLFEKLSLISKDTWANLIYPGDHE